MAFNSALEESLDNQRRVVFNVVASLGQGSVQVTGITGIARLVRGQDGDHVIPSVQLELRLDQEVSA